MEHVLAANGVMLPFCVGPVSVTRHPRRVDRFLVRLPLAVTQLCWDVVVDSSRPDAPPDFIFDDKVELLEPFLPMQLLDKFVHWTWSTEAFVSLMKHLIVARREHVLRQARNHSCLAIGTEVRLLEQSEIFQTNQFDLALQGDGSLTIRLLINTLSEKIAPSRLQEALRHQPLSLELLLKPRGAAAFDADFKPFFPQELSGAGLAPSKGATTAVDYVTAIVTAVENFARRHAEVLVLRRQYIAAFLVHFGSGLIEYDLQSFSRLSLLMEYKRMLFVLKVELGDTFPQQQPIFVLIPGSFGVYPQVFSNYPYSPRWSTDEMARRARIFLVDTLPQAATLWRKQDTI